MYHSLIFIDPSTNKKINTYDDWFLAPTERPVVSPASLKEKYLEIPGASLSIDMSEALTGYPTFENRKGSFTFFALNALDDIPDVQSWNRRLNEISDFLHGKQMKMFLEDEQDYFYFGRFTVDKWTTKSNAYRSEITIKYNLEPYKWTLQLTNEPWLWDPFSFEYGYTDEVGPQKYALQVNSPSSFKEYVFGNDGYETRVPTVPVFLVSNVTQTMTLRFVNEHLGIDVTHTLSDGENELLDCIITNNTWKMYVKGAGTIQIVYRKGRI